MTFVQYVLYHAAAIITIIIIIIIIIIDRWFIQIKIAAKS